MPQITPIKEILDQRQPDELIQCVQATLYGVWDFATGQGQHGEWTRQNITLKDRTGQIKATLWNHPEIQKSDKNKLVTISSVRGQRGWTGITVKEDSWTDKQTGQPRTAKTLQISKTAEMVFGQGQPSADAPTQRELPMSKMTFIQVKRRVAKLAALYLLCRRAAENSLDREADNGNVVAPDDVHREDFLRGMTGCIYIDASRNPEVMEAMPMELPVAGEAPQNPSPEPAGEPEPPPEPPAAPAANPPPAESDDDDIPF